MSSCRVLVIVLLLLFSSAPANAWGPKAHKIVAMIASNRLSPAARVQVKALLADDADGTTLPAVAAWADDVKNSSHPQTYNWHFVDIPVGGRPTLFDRQRDCPTDPRRGDCIIAALERQQRTLEDTRAPFKQRREALKFLTHLIADLHQPLHCGERDRDRGGNDVEVVFLGRHGWNLHSVWDSGLIDAADLSQNRYVQKLTQTLREQDVDRMGTGSFVDWANEAHTFAVTHVYRTPTGRPVVNRTKLDQRYVDAGLDVVDQQLARAGVRLATLLNATLR